MPIETEKDEIYKYLDATVRKIIQKVSQQKDRGDIATALFLLLIREANTWRTIQFLLRETPSEFIDSVLIDVGALLRTMFDAYLQAHFVLHDPTQQQARAKLYLDFEHVERFHLVDRGLRHGNELSKRLQLSPQRSEGDARNNSAYEGVKANYLGRNGRDRHTWYEGNLYELSKAAGQEDEYDMLIWPLHSCVHSGPITLRHGPQITDEFAAILADKLLSRVALLMADQVGADLGDARRVLEEMSKKLWNSA